MNSKTTLVVMFVLFGSTLAVAQLRDVTVNEIPGVVAAGAKWSVAWQGTDNADGIVGTADGGVLFAQEQPNRVSKLDQNDRVSVFIKDTHGAGSLSMDSNDRVVAVLRTCTDPGNSGRGITTPCSEPTAIALLTPERKVLAQTVDGKSFGRPNDLVVAKNGGVYFTSGEAFYMNPGGKVSSIGGELRTNGIMLSPDEQTLYITNGMVLVAFDVQRDGSVTNRRDFASLKPVAQVMA